ncbi:MAG TPA: hypothetical protein VJH24_04240 [Candidatus Bilamarchaeaceae archaeon]|nr:hypothetical protein [Candidatus Bilamarchaeaceae archaeon]
MADWITSLLLYLNPYNLKTASYIFIATYLFVKGAYKAGIVDANAIVHEKHRKGTLAIQTILLVLGILALALLHLSLDYYRMQSLLFRMPHITYMLIIGAVIVFAYVADFLKNVVQVYESREDGIQRFLHFIVDTVNLVYGLAFAFFALPVLYYLILDILTPG